MQSAIRMANEVIVVPDDLIARLIEIRRHLHTNPELSNLERETQDYLRKALRAEGLLNVRDAAGFGLFVDVQGQRAESNRAIAIRADIDALPIVEETGLDFASTKPGVMHACGHDAHTAIIVATAATLHRNRDKFAGTVRFILQPAEEAEPLGARRIVAEGLLDNVQAAIGIHVDPYLETGKVAVAAGPCTLASDIFDIRIFGKPAHAATPMEGVDALAIGAALIGELQRIVSREVSAFEAVVLSVTGFNAGGAYNLIADRATIKGTIRTSNADTRLRVHRRLHDIATNLANAHGALAEIDIVTGEPAVNNSPELVALIARSARDCLGTNAVVDAPSWAAADDFAFYSERLPSVYFRIGVTAPGEADRYAIHHPKFRIDERAMSHGVSVLTNAALRFLD